MADGMRLVGAAELERALKKFPDAVSKRAADTGLRKAAVDLRRVLRAAAPRETGHLRSALTFKYSRRSGRAFVGLGKSGKRFGGSGAKVPFYYKTLELRTGRAGTPFRPFFMKAYDRHKRALAQLIVKETQDALVAEAVKTYRVTKARAARR